MTGWGGISSPSAGGGTFEGDHNDITGRTAASAHPATAVSVSAAGFDGNLETTDDTVQKVAQKVDDLTISAGGRNEYVAYAIDNTTPVDGSATEVAFYTTGTADTLGTPIPLMFAVGGLVFRPGIADGKIYTVTGSGAWTQTATLNGGDTIYSPIQNIEYVGTNTTDAGGVGTDPNDVATTIVTVAPFLAVTGNLPNGITPSFVVVMTNAEAFDVSGDMAVTSSDGYTLLNDDYFVTVGALNDPLTGFWHLPTAGIGETPTKLGPGDVVQDVPFELFSRHNYDVKIAKGTRGQRLAKVIADNDGATVREYVWMAAADVRGHDQADIDLYTGTTTTETVGGLTITRRHEPDKPDIMWIRNDNPRQIGVPSVAAGAAAGTGPTLNFLSGSTDDAGGIIVTTGTSPATGTLVTFTLDNDFLEASAGIGGFYPGDSATAAIMVSARIYMSFGGDGTFALVSGTGGTPLAAETAYAFYYDVKPYVV